MCHDLHKNRCVPCWIQTHNWGLKLASNFILDDDCFFFPNLISLFFGPCNQLRLEKLLPFIYHKLPSSLSPRSTMGFLEFGHLYLYPLRWYSSKSRGPHLKGQICQLGSVDTGAGPGQDCNCQSIYWFITQTCHSWASKKAVRLLWKDSVRVIFISK